MPFRRKHNFPSKSFWLWPGLFVAGLVLFNTMLFIWPCDEGMEIIGCGFFFYFVLTLALLAAIVYFLIAIPMRISENRGNRYHWFMYFLVGFLACSVSFPILMITKGVPLDWLMGQTWLQDVSLRILGS